MEHSYLSVIDEKADLLRETADYLWDNPETAFTEYKSAACICDVLRREGFAVEENLADIATAFSGTYGSGKPVIGNLTIASGKKVTLEPMNPYERRIIHSVLQADRAVETHSDGEEPYRKVIISPKRRRNQ